MRISIPLFSVSAILLLAPGICAAHTRDLPFAERVQAQASIERAYHAHQVGATGSFEDAILRAVLEDKVRQYLKQTRALERYWNTWITAEMLEREVERIARGSRMPERLLELFRALGNNSFLVQECIARPALVDRLARSFFEHDGRIHAPTRREAERLRADLVSGFLDPVAEHPRRARVRVEAGPEEASNVELLDAPLDRVRLDHASFAGWRHGLPEEVRAIGPLVEERDRFLIEVVLEEQPGQAVVARYSVPKRSWPSWWAEVADGLDETVVPAVAVADASVLETAREIVGARGGGAPEGGAPCLPDDTWLSGSLDDWQPARYAHTAVWTGSSMIVWGGRTGVSPNPSIVYTTGARYDPTIDDWTSISPIGAPSARLSHRAVWTGQVMIIWGGSITTQIGTGARYDPSNDSWTPVTTVGAPVGRTGHTAVWTGTEMIVWGGNTLGGSTNTGGRYDPTTDTWLPMSVVGAPEARDRHSAVWTGTELIVWGGRGNGLLDTGGRYDPSTDTWASLSTAGAPSIREAHPVVWTGSSMIVWGGWNGQTSLNTGGRYDPGTDSWTPTTMVQAPTASSSHSAVWSGSEMLIWGGGLAGARYNPVLDAWSSIFTSGQPPAESGHSSIWTGSSMIVWGGLTQTGPSTWVFHNTGGRYDPVADAWTPTTVGEAPSQALNGRAVWTGNLMVVWNPSGSGAGARYDPTLDAWTHASVAGAPVNRGAVSLVWAGGRMVAWGGVSSSTYLNTGGRYDPVNDSWTGTSTVGAPSGRANHSAISSGNEMIVWGGQTAGVPLQTGGRYDPVADTWHPTSTVGAPDARREHKAVWAGSRMIVWGGRPSGTVLFATGGRYDPSTDTWLPTETSNAPAARYHHTMIWTGDRMVVWGGAGSSSVLDTGSRYDPVANSWAGTSMLGAPAPRRQHGAVWSGSRMIVWGGSDDSNVINTGGRYDPVGDSWEPTSMSNAPAPSLPDVVWTAGIMLVWQGLGGGAYAFGHSTDDDGDDLSECAGDCNDADAAVHPGADEVCDGLDTDCDPATNETTDHDGDGRTACMGDCAPADAGVFASPQLIQNLIFEPDGDLMSWASASPTAGSATVYDVAMGLLQQFPVGSGPVEDCFASGSITAKASTAAAVPPENSGYWFLVRGRNTCGQGPYGFASNGAEETTTVCP